MVDANIDNIDNFVLIRKLNWTSGSKTLGIHTLWFGGREQLTNVEEFLSENIRNQFPYYSRGETRNL